MNSRKRTFEPSRVFPPFLFFIIILMVRSGYAQSLLPTGLKASLVAQVPLDIHNLSSGYEFISQTNVTIQMRLLSPNGCSLAIQSGTYNLERGSVTVMMGENPDDLVFAPNVTGTDSLDKWHSILSNHLNLTGLECYNLSNLDQPTTSGGYVALPYDSRLLMLEFSVSNSAGQTVPIKLAVKIGASPFAQLADRAYIADRLRNPISNSQLDSTAFPISKIPDLDAAKLVTGQINLARLPAPLDGSGCSDGQILKKSGLNWICGSESQVINGDFEIQGQIKITGGSPGAGKVLASDAVGLASWVAPGSMIAGGSTGDVQINNGGSLVGSSNLFWDQANSRLGIGNSAPTEKLNVTGNMITSGFGVFGSTSPQYDARGGPARLYAHNPNGIAAKFGLGSGGKLQLITWSGGSAFGDIDWITDDGSGTAAQIRGGAESTGLIFRTQNQDRMRVFPNGQIGIGVSSPLAQLHVVAASGTTGDAPDAFIVTGGAGGTNGRGADISMRAGDGSGSGVGGDVSIAAGSGVGSPHFSPRGNLYLSAGDNGGSTGGTTILRSGHYAGVGGSTLTLTGSGSLITGEVTLATANGNGLVGASGGISIRTGNAFSGYSGVNAGDITLQAGNGGAATSLGGRIYLTAGNGGSIDNNGSNVVVNPGAKTGTGLDGNVVLANLRGNVGVGTDTPETRLQVNGVIAPSLDNTHDLGTSLLRFRDVYAANSVIQTSDERLKTEIQDADLGLSFINSLRPVSYRWAQGDSGLHYGLLAQPTQSALLKAKKESGNVLGSVDQFQNTIVTQDSASGRYGIRYTELIAPVIKALQELYKDWVEARALIAQLNADLNKQAQELENLRRQQLEMQNWLCQQYPKTQQTLVDTPNFCRK